MKKAKEMVVYQLSDLRVETAFVIAENTDCARDVFVKKEKLKNQDEDDRIPVIRRPIKKCGRIFGKRLDPDTLVIPVK